MFAAVTTTKKHNGEGIGGWWTLRILIYCRDEVKCKWSE